ncbi:hypothetical protein PVOR_05288 [Paenibacillus vortex V453]|uniref:Uncharacterized protein n=1 Tax=Paenibacillus vortex V453 TaxID=715225 RepID=A0A2R9T0I5_9BACL|nr:hypothetical protein PVOR_05288 [Paenibacillus vortex V453]
MKRSYFPIGVGEKLFIHPGKKVQSKEMEHKTCLAESALAVHCIDRSRIQGPDGKKVELQVILQPFTLRLRSENGMLDDTTRLKVRE